MDPLRPNPIIVHICTMLEKATQEQLRLVYQLVKALVQPPKQNELK